jgi:hypothetical protein
LYIGLVSSQHTINFFMTHHRICYQERAHRCARFSSCPEGSR